MKALNRFVIGIVVWSLSANFALAAELSKADAAKLMGFMGYKNPNIAAVINGVGIIPESLNTYGSPNAAVVVGIGESDKGSKTFAYSFFFDKDVGWFYYENDEKGARVRMWTLRGYMEIKLSK